jgi:D-3-phosphoglycerate dehydrogenase
MPRPFKILAADTLAPEGLAFIESQPDAELVNRPGLSEAELAAIVGAHDGMIVRSGVQVTARVLAEPGQLKAIARAGVGVDNIDLDAATERGILVMNTAEASTISTAEMAFTLIMALARRIGPASASMTQGNWNRSKFTGMQLAGKTLGIVGFGRIGQTVAHRALAFGMRVVASDPFINVPTMMDGQVKMYRRFEDVLPHADLLTFHVPLNDQTRQMLDAAALAQCRRGVLIVNASRGGVIDETALLAALDEGQCGGAALDVFESEPPAEDHPLRRHERVLLTPHLGASTTEAQQAVSISAAEELLDYLRGRDIRGAVNADGLRVDLDPLQACFVDLARRMAQLVSPMVGQGITEVRVELSGEALVSAAATIECVTLVNLLKAHLDTTLNMINVRQIAEQRGIRLRSITSDEDRRNAPQLVIEVDSPSDARPRRIVGRVYDDRRPRVVEINGYHMDMVPHGVMVLIQNEDRPGMLGLVGAEFGRAQVNIADMAISRREQTALMLLNIDEAPRDELLETLRTRPGILKVAMVKLPGENDWRTPTA